jgi:hypothetical protein
MPRTVNSSQLPVETWMKNYFPDWRNRDAGSITDEMVANRLQDPEENNRILRHPVLCLEGHA